MCLSQHKNRAPKEQRERDSVKILCENKGKCFGARMKNKWEGQFIDLSIGYKYNVMPLCSSVLNKTVSRELVPYDKIYLHIP